MKRVTPYLLLTPALLFTAFVLVYPAVQNLVNSVRDVSLTGGGTGAWVGMHNYMRILNDGLFLPSLRNTALYALTGTLLSLAIGLIFALILNITIRGVTPVASLIYTTPWVISPVVAGFAWKWMLNDNYGIINHWLVRAGLVSPGMSWLGNAGTALLCVAVARVWQFYPFAMIMFLAALQTIPQEQYEAAAVDGATTVRKFLHITIPHLRPVTTVLLLLGLIWSFNDFNMVFVMTRGGPINASMVLPVLVREYSFVEFDLGKGSALSVVVFGMLVVLSTVYLRMLPRRDDV
jgi:multiple sugar transport system permease protein